MRSAQKVPTSGKTFFGASNVWKNFLAALLFSTSCFAAGDAESLYQQGREALQRYSREPNDTADLRAAERAFAQALAAEPQHPGACWFHITTRFQLLALDPELGDAMTRLGLDAQGRNPARWQAKPAYPLPASRMNLSELAELADRKIGPELDYALNALAQIPPAWGESFVVDNADSTRLGKPMRMGLAEMQMMQCGLRLAKLGLLAARMYDLNLPLDGLVASTAERSVEIPGGVLLKTLAAQPQLGTVKNRDLLPEARALIEDAVKSFHLADQLVRKRGADQPESALSVSQMDRIRPYILSLLGPSRVDFTREDSYLLNLGRLFEEPLPDRKLLPEFTADNGIKLGTFSDPTFGGIVPDMTLTRLTDYLRWNRAASKNSNDLFAVCFAAGRFVAVGDRGTILTSQDGLEWTIRASGTEAALKGVAHSAGGWVAVGARGTILTSADGGAWAQAGSGASEELESVAKGVSGWVAVGQNGAIVFSADGKAWRRVASPVANHLWCVTWAKGRFVAAGSKGISTTSTDGTTWSKPEAEGGESIIALAESGWEIRGATYEGSMLNSLDGLRWQKVSASTNFTAGLWGVYAGPAGQVAVGNQGLLYLSSDGRDWLRQVTRSYEAFRGAAEGKGRYVVVGTKGRILQGYSSAENAVAVFRGNSGDIVSQARQGLPMVQARHANTLGAASSILLERPKATDESTVDTFMKQRTPDNTPTPQNAAATSAGVFELLTTGPVQAGERIRVKLLATVDPKKAWVAFYRGDDAEDRAYVTYTFCNNLMDSTYDVKAPDEPGRYHFRLFGAEGYDCIGRSASIEIR